MRRIFLLVLLLIQPSATPMASAQTLAASSVRIEWRVANRFRLFRDPAFFQFHENAWRQYLIHVDSLDLPPDQKGDFIARTSVLGSEHVLNDRRIAFSKILRKNFDWRGWASKGLGELCYDQEKRQHSACGGIDNYLTPKSHAIELWLSPIDGNTLPEKADCEWRIGGNLVATASCSQPVRGAAIELPYPGGGEISVNVIGEQPVSVHAAAKDILIAGLGDSFASGEGNPDRPVEFGSQRRFRNLYPLRKPNNVGGSARWVDELCHRSLYSHQLRAALQLSVENPRSSVTFLDYSCSGAAIDNGILGPQSYVERITETRASSGAAARALAGDTKDSQIFRLLRELCLEKPHNRDGLLICPDSRFRRTLDFVFLSVGGNDIGFSNIVAWATLREGISAQIAGFFGATVSASEFRASMKEVLPGAYAHLAKAMETALPLYSANDGVFDPSRIILTAYPDMVTDERGTLCEAHHGDGPDDLLAANQSLDLFSSWLAADPNRLERVRKEFSSLFKAMRDLAEDHGWTFAGHVYADRMFDGHGFCARNDKMASDPAEVLMIPCWGKAERDTQTCQSSWSGKIRNWRPYDPARQNFPYALRQRWVRTFNDAYMVINQKVVDRDGRIDEEASASVFSETTGALHPTAEGHAAMADALLLSVRPMIRSLLDNN